MAASVCDSRSLTLYGHAGLTAHNPLAEDIDTGRHPHHNQSYEGGYKGSRQSPGPEPVLSRPIAVPVLRPRPVVPAGAIRLPAHIMFLSVKFTIFQFTSPICPFLLSYDGSRAYITSGIHIGPP